MAGLKMNVRKTRAMVFELVKKECPEMDDFDAIDIAANAARNIHNAIERWVKSEMSDGVRETVEEKTPRRRSPAHKAGTA